MCRVAKLRFMRGIVLWLEFCRQITRLKHTGYDVVALLLLLKISVHHLSALHSFHLHQGGQSQLQLTLHSVREHVDSTKCFPVGKAFL